MESSKIAKVEQIDNPILLCISCGNWQEKKDLCDYCGMSTLLPVQSLQVGNANALRVLVECELKPDGNINIGAVKSFRLQELLEDINLVAI